jgi:hypothetical protein
MVGLTQSIGDAAIKQPFEYFAYKGGLIAADALLFILRNAEMDNANEATLNKALNKLEPVIQQNYGKDKPIPRNKRDMQKAWKDFQPAAHLWAATRVVSIMQQKGDSCSVADHLAIAEELRKRGEAHTPIRTDRHTLKSEETWKVAPDIKLPPVDLSLQDILSPKGD